MIQLRTVIAIGLCLLLFLAVSPTGERIAWGAQTQSTWAPNTVGDMRASAAFVDGQLEDGEYVFSVMGHYYSLANHTSPYTPRIYHTVSPQHGQIEGLNRTAYHDEARAAFVADLQDGTLALLIMTRRTDYMLDRWPDAREAFRANYCKIEPTPDVYARNGVGVFEYAPERADCTNRTQFEG